MGVNVKTYLPLFILLPLVSQAELSSLNDSELAAVDGEGISFVLEDYVYDASDATVTIKDISGTDQITVEKLYIMGSGSNKGTTKQAITLGRLENPFSLDIVDVEGGSNKALSFKFPDFVANRGGDFGITNKFTLSTGRTDVLEMSATDFSLDGSEIRLWGDGSETFGDLQLRIHADTIQLKNRSCATSSCDIATGGEYINLTNVDADLRIGYGDVFPANFSVTTDGNFRLKATGLTSSNYAAYYATPKSYVTIDNFNFGGTNLGKQTTTGIRLQYLDLQSHDI